MRITGFRSTDKLLKLKKKKIVMTDNDSPLCSITLNILAKIKIPYHQISVLWSIIYMFEPTTYFFMNLDFRWINFLHQHIKCTFIIATVISEVITTFRPLIC
jgi:hypothetical protein